MISGDHPPAWICGLAPLSVACNRCKTTSHRGTPDSNGHGSEPQNQTQGPVARLCQTHARAALPARLCKQNCLVQMPLSHTQVPVDKIVEVFVDVPCERIVEKIVEVPVERVVIKEVPVEVVKEVIVEKIVEVRSLGRMIIRGLGL